jgi:DNA-directed RNA polymerase specialized sigma24 family protein
MVREAMAALDNRCDTLLRALFLESDQSYVATAERLGIAVGSIGPIRARCLARLRTILNERGFLPQDVP